MCRHLHLPDDPVVPLKTGGYEVVPVTTSKLVVAALAFTRVLATIYFVIFLIPFFL
jgi:hypothetical protein